MQRARTSEVNALMGRLADGDRGAFDPLFTALWPVVSRFAARVLDSVSDGEDAAQQALLKIFARAGQFDPERDAVAWALGITMWECRTLRRRAQRRGKFMSSRAPCEPGGALDQRADERPTPDRIVERRQLEAALAEALGELSPRDREALVGALSRTDVRGAAIKPATIRKRRARALARLRGVWRLIHGAD